MPNVLLENSFQFTGTTELCELNVSEIFSQNEIGVFGKKILFVLSPKISDYFSE